MVVHSKKTKAKFSAIIENITAVLFENILLGQMVAPIIHTTAKPVNCRT